MTQYRVSEKTEERLEKFLASRRLEDVAKKSGWQKTRGNLSQKYGAAESFTFDDAIQELLTAAGF